MAGKCSRGVSVPALTFRVAHFIEGFKRIIHMG
jgi:hypothetical protein